MISKDFGALTGFTLFFNPVKKNWQLSLRYEGVDGWDVKFVSDKEAQDFLSDLDQKVEHPKHPEVVADRINFKKDLFGRPLQPQKKQRVRL